LFEKIENQQTKGDVENNIENSNSEIPVPEQLKSFVTESGKSTKPSTKTNYDKRA